MPANFGKYSQAGSRGSAEGKQIIHAQDTENRARQYVKVPWVMPMAQLGQASAGIILRQSDGTIMFVPFISLRICLTTIDSEISACMEGVKLVLGRFCFGHLVEAL
jgi:hypothetical protein